MVDVLTQEMRKTGSASRFRTLEVLRRRLKAVPELFLLS
jgi:hypothetical protein